MSKNKTKSEQLSFALEKFANIKQYDIRSINTYEKELNFWYCRLSWVLQCISPKGLPEEIVNVIIGLILCSNTLFSFLCQITTYNDMRLLDFITCNTDLDTWNEICESFNISIIWTEFTSKPLTESHTAACGKSHSFNRVEYTNFFKIGEKYSTTYIIPITYNCYFDRYLYVQSEESLEICKEIVRRGHFGLLDKSIVEMEMIFNFENQYFNVGDPSEAFLLDEELIDFDEDEKNSWEPIIGCKPVLKTYLSFNGRYNFDDILFPITFGYLLFIFTIHMSPDAYYVFVLDDVYYSVGSLEEEIIDWYVFEVTNGQLMESKLHLKELSHLKIGKVSDTILMKTIIQ